MFEAMNPVRRGALSEASSLVISTVCTTTLCNCSGNWAAISGNLLYTTPVSAMLFDLRGNHAMEHLVTSRIEQDMHLKRLPLNGEPVLMRCVCPDRHQHRPCSLVAYLIGIVGEFTCRWLPHATHRRSYRCVGSQWLA